MKTPYSLFLFIFILLGCSAESEDVPEKKNEPLEISLLSLDKIEEEQAYAHGSIQNFNESSITKLGFCWSLEPDPTVSDNTVTVNSIAAEFSSAISNLKPNTTYYLKAFVTDGSRTLYSEEKNFTTDASLVMIINSVEDISTRHAKVIASIENLEDTEIDEIGLVLSTIENPDMSDKLYKVSSVTEEFSSVLEELEPNTTYFLRSYAIVEGEVVFSDEVSFTTEPVRIACQSTYRFDTNYEERPEAGVKTADGGFLITGYVLPFYGNSDADALILKYNINCELQWEKVLRDPGTSEFPQNIIEDREGNILISSLLFNSNGSKSALTKLDPAGNIVWQKIIDEAKSNTDEKFGNESLIQTMDGNYVMVGNRNPDFYSDQHPDSNFSVIKVSQSGELIFQYHYGKEGNTEHAWDLIENSNGDLLLIGSAEGNSGSSDLKLVKLNADGIFQWEQLHGGSRNEYPRSVIPSLDGNLFVAGSSSSNTNQYQLWVFKLDWEGDMIWETSVEKENLTIEVDGPTSIIQGSDSNLYVAAEISGDVFVVSLDSGGSELWTKAFSAPQGGFEAATSIVQLDNGDLMVAGYKEDELNPSFDGNRNDIWILKLTNN